MKIAVRKADVALTYRELDLEANRIASLLNDAGLRPGGFAGISAERSPETVAGLLGILKAGGVYVPLDPDYPPERLATLIHDAGVGLLLATRRCHDLFSAYALPMIGLDLNRGNPANESLAIPTVFRSAVQPAYVMYTSGSTGKPKGVVVCHRNVVRLVFNNDYVQLGSDQKILQTAPLSFDASTFEIWGPLLHGGECIFYPEAVPTAAGLKREIDQHSVSTLWLTSTLFNSVMDEAPDALSGLKQLLIGGEALSSATREKGPRCASRNADYQRLWSHREHNLCLHLFHLGNARPGAHHSSYRSTDRKHPGVRSRPTSKPRPSGCSG